MAITEGTPITELDVVVRIELGRRLEELVWAQELAPNDSVYSVSHVEGSPNSVYEKLLNAYLDPVQYTPVASIADCQAAECSWYYDSSTALLYVHASGGVDPGGGSILLMSLFWKPFGNVIIDVDGVPCEPLLDKKSVPGLAQEIALFSQGGTHVSFGEIELKNDAYFFYTDLSLHEYQAKRLECYVGNTGSPFASFWRYFTGWTGDYNVNDEVLSIAVEDLRLYIP